MVRHMFPALALIFLAACGQKDTDSGPGGVSVGEARALDEAASMLDQQRLPLQAQPSGSPSPQQAPISATPAPPARE